MEIPKIDVQDSKLPQIINDMEKGKLQVPRFQREFVWPLTKTRALLDSIFKEYPIGTFFLWRVPGVKTQFFRTLDDLGIPKPTEGAELAYMLDGQQRLTSLYVAIKGIKYQSRLYEWICLDLETATQFMQNHDEDFNEDIFVYKKPDNQRYVSVCDLVGKNDLQIFDQIKLEWKRAFTKARDLINNYPLSVVWIQDQDMSSAIVIFQRINQGGQKLSRYDLVCANVWTEDFDFRTRVANENKLFSSKGFGWVHETIFTQAFALILFERCTILDEFNLKTDQIKNVWDKVINALRLAVDFASNNLGVKRAEFLPYRGILAVLTYYFYHSPNPSAKERLLIWQWYWQVTLSERYSSTSPSRMQEDIAKFKLALKQEEVRFNYPVHVTAEAISGTKMSSTSSALRNAALCLLALKEPRNFKNNSHVNIKDDYFSNLIRAERHHVFPYGYLRHHNIKPEYLDSLANFCFIPADLNKEIGMRSPAEYMTDFRNENPDFMKSAETHFIPIDSNSPIWSTDSSMEVIYRNFLNMRASLLADELNRIASSSPDSLVPSKSPLEFMLDEDEIQIREVIHTIFDRVMGKGYWKKVIPSDIQDEVQKKIKFYIQKNPQDEQLLVSSDRARIDFCDFSDYGKIIQKNWDLFSGLFSNRNELERHLNNLRDLRNAFKHNHPPTEIEKKSGEAALLWISACLNRMVWEELQVEEVQYDEEIMTIEKE